MKVTIREPLRLTLLTVGTIAFAFVGWEYAACYALGGLVGSFSAER